MEESKKVISREDGIKQGKGENNQENKQVMKKKGSRQVETMDITYKEKG